MRTAALTPKKRAVRLLIALSAMLICGVLYAAFISATGIGIPCIFHAITGLKCPGCGVSRMCLSLLRLDFKSAMKYNPAVMSLSPLGIVVFADMSVRYVKTGTLIPDRFSNAAMIFMIAVLIAFGIIRNLI